MITSKKEEMSPQNDIEKGIAAGVRYTAAANPESCWPGCVISFMKFGSMTLTGVTTLYCYYQISKHASADLFPDGKLFENIVAELLAHDSGVVNGFLFAWLVGSAFDNLIRRSVFNASEGKLEKTKNWHHFSSKLQDEILFTDPESEEYRLYTDDNCISVTQSIGSKFRSISSLLILTTLCAFTGAAYMYKVAVDGELQYGLPVALLLLRAFANAYTVKIQYRYYQAYNKSEKDNYYREKFCLYNLLDTMTDTLKGLRRLVTCSNGKVWDLLNLMVVMALPLMSYNSLMGSLPDWQMALILSFSSLVSSIVASCFLPRQDVYAFEKSIGLFESVKCIVACVAIAYTCGYFFKTAESLAMAFEHFGLSNNIFENGASGSMFAQMTVDVIASVFNGIFNLHFVQLGVSELSHFCQRYALNSIFLVLSLLSIGVGIATDLTGKVDLLESIALIGVAGSTAFLMNYPVVIGFYEATIGRCFKAVGPTCYENQNNSQTKEWHLSAGLLIVSAAIFSPLYGTGISTTLAQDSKLSWINSFLILTALSGLLGLFKPCVDGLGVLLAPSSPG